MPKHPTLDQLHALGLYGMAKAFAELAETDEAKDLDRNDWLALLLDREAFLRRDKRLTARLRAAKLRQPAVDLHFNGVCFTLGASRIPEAVASSREAVQCWLDHTSTA